MAVRLWLCVYGTTCITVFSVNGNIVLKEWPPVANLWCHRDNGLRYGGDIMTSDLEDKLWIPMREELWKPVFTLKITPGKVVNNNFIFNMSTFCQGRPKTDDLETSFRVGWFGCHDQVPNGAFYLIEMGLRNTLTFLPQPFWGEVRYEAVAVLGAGGRRRESSHRRRGNPLVQS